MPFDPLSAFAVASSAIQLVDFSSKIVSKGKFIYKSADRVLRENAKVETVTVWLQEISSKLEGSILADSAGLNSDQL